MSGHVPLGHRAVVSRHMDCRWNNGCSRAALVRALLGPAGTSDARRPYRARRGTERMLVWRLIQLDAHGTVPGHRAAASLSPSTCQPDAQATQVTRTRPSGNPVRSARPSVAAFREARAAGEDLSELGGPQVRAVERAGCGSECCQPTTRERALAPEVSELGGPKVRAVERAGCGSECCQPGKRGSPGHPAAGRGRDRESTAKPPRTPGYGPLCARFCPKPFELRELLAVPHCASARFSDETFSLRACRTGNQLTPGGRPPGVSPARRRRARLALI